MGRHIIVYGSTIEKAFNKLQELLDEMKKENIKEVKKLSVKNGQFTIKLYNGDYYQAIRVSDNARGFRWQYAYVDKDTDEELLNNVVLCKFIPEYGTDDYWNYDINSKDYYEWY